MVTRVVLDPRRDPLDGRYAVRILDDRDGVELDSVGWADTLEAALAEARGQLESGWVVVDVLELQP